jgi:hypothetical protein
VKEGRKGIMGVNEGSERMKKVTEGKGEGRTDGRTEGRKVTSPGWYRDGSEEGRKGVKGRKCRKEVKR